MDTKLKIDLVALLLSIVALFRPNLEKLWRKLQSKVVLLPHKKVDLTFNNFGACLTMRGVLRSENLDSFVENIELEVERLKDGAKHKLEWFAFAPIKIQGTLLSDLEYPAGFMLYDNQPKQFQIAFVDMGTNSEIVSIAQSLHQEFSEDLLLRKAFSKSTPQETEKIVQDFYTEFSARESHVKAFSAIKDVLYWKTGDYKLTVRVYSSNSKVLSTSEWTFSIVDKEASIVDSNVVKILPDLLGVTNQYQYFVIYPAISPHVS